LTVKKTAPKGKAAKDPNKPKRPLKQFKEENPTISYVVAVRILSKSSVRKAGEAKWKLMSESRARQFCAKAEQEKTEPEIHRASQNGQLESLSGLVLQVSRRLLESHGCLLLVGKDYAYSWHFTIYEKKNAYYEWLLKYIVDLDDILMSFPRRWSICSTVFGIILGEREEDSFLVLC
ncbi:HMG1/2-like protein, partial [Tanacetum coccineum]